MKLFEYAAIYVPQCVAGDESLKAQIICQPTPVLAKDEKQAALLAARALPEDYIDKLSEVEIIVRPF